MILDFPAVDGDRLESAVENAFQAIRLLLDQIASSSPISESAAVAMREYFKERSDLVLKAVQSVNGYSTHVSKSTRLQLEEQLIELRLKAGLITVEMR